MDKRFLHAGYGLLGFGVVMALLANAYTQTRFVDLDDAFFGLPTEAAAATLVHAAFIATLVSLVAIVFSAFVEPKDTEEP